MKTDGEKYVPKNWWRR